MSKGKLNILLWVLNGILLLIFLIPIGEPPAIIQFIGRLHPLILHFPIVLLIAAFVFEMFGSKSRNAEYRKPAALLLWAGAFTAVITAIAGYLLSLNGEYSGVSFDYHKWMGLGTSLLAGIIVLIRQKGAHGKSFLVIYATLILLLIVTGHFGATLTHGEGFLTNVFKEEASLALNMEEPVFTQVVSPILNSKCTSCHNSGKLKGGLLLDSQEGILKGGESGEVLTPGDLNSPLVHNVLLPHEDDHHMPPKGKTQLSNEEIKLLTWWVETGASFSQKVSEVGTEDPIQIVFANHFKEDEKPNVDFVDAALIQSLSTEAIRIKQISVDSPFLEVNIGNHSDLSSDDIKGLRKIRKQIYSLDLGNSHIDKAILKEVTRFKNLKRLYLDNTQVDDEMASILSKISGLEYLNLYGSKVTKKGAEKMAKLPNIQQLYLWQTNIEDAAMEDLKASYPDIQINTGLSENSAFAIAQLAPPKMSFASSFFEAKMTIDVSYGLSETEIYYQLDDQTPKMVQDGKIEINQSAKLSLIAKKEGWQDSNPIEQVFIKVAKNSIQKSSLKFDPKGEYKASGIKTLFDLKKGSENFKDGQWLGFNGDDLLLDIELAENTPIESVFVSTMEDLGSWIFPSLTMEVWGGASADQMVKLNELKFIAPEGPEPKQMKIHRIQFVSTQMKYMRIHVKNYGVLPEWHPGKGNSTWLFIDEIVIE